MNEFLNELAANECRKWLDEMDSHHENNYREDVECQSFWKVGFMWAREHQSSSVDERIAHLWDDGYPTRAVIKLIADECMRRGKELADLKRTTHDH